MSLHEGHKAGKSIGIACSEYQSFKELHLIMRKGMVTISIGEAGKELASVDIGFRFFFGMASQLFQAFYGEDYNGKT